MFLKQKFDATGKYLKLKARLVAGGHRQREDTYTNTSSPTVDISSVFLALGLSTYLDNCSIFNADVPAAYLNCDLNEFITMKIPKSVADIIIKEYPEVSKFQMEDGSLIVKLLKSLYGLKQSSAEWYYSISKNLVEKAGYTISSVDKCVFMKRRGPLNLLSIVTLHADDLLLITQDKNEAPFMQRVLPNEYGSVDFNSSNISYLGMKISKSEEGAIEVKQTGYVTKVVEKSEVQKTFKTPATADLFETIDDQTIDYS